MIWLQVNKHSRKQGMTAAEVLDLVAIQARPLHLPALTLILTQTLPRSTPV